MENKKKYSIVPYVITSSITHIILLFSGIILFALIDRIIYIGYLSGFLFIFGGALSIVINIAIQKALQKKIYNAQNYDTIKKILLILIIIFIALLVISWFGLFISAFVSNDSYSGLYLLAAIGYPIILAQGYGFLYFINYLIVKPLFKDFDYGNIDNQKDLTN